MDLGFIDCLKKSELRYELYQLGIYYESEKKSEMKTLLKKEWERKNHSLIEFQTTRGEEIEEKARKDLLLYQSRRIKEKTIQNPYLPFEIIEKIIAILLIRKDKTVLSFLLSCSDVCGLFRSSKLMGIRNIQKQISCLNSAVNEWRKISQHYNYFKPDCGGWNMWKLKEIFNSAKCDYYPDGYPLSHFEYYYFDQRMAALIGKLQIKMEEYI